MARRWQPKPRRFLAILGVLVIGSWFSHLVTPAARVGAASPPAPAPTWQVMAHPTTPWAIGYGTGGTFPQFAALDPLSGYFRLVCQTTWGTSIVLTPCFWSGNVLTQGMPLAATTHVAGNKLIIDATGTRNGVTVTLKVTLSPPTASGITAEVDAQCAGNVTLDTRPGEAFKMVMLSSMRTTAVPPSTVSTEYDARSVVVDARPMPPFDDLARPSDFFLKPTTATSFGVVGGKSAWQMGDPAPSVVIQLDAPTPVAGYRTMDTNPNDDNLGFWAASDTLVRSWHYTITASCPPTK